MEQLGACTMFAGMPQVGEPAYDDVDMHMSEMIHDRGRSGGGCYYKDGQVDNSESTHSGTYTQ